MKKIALVLGLAACILPVAAQAPSNEQIGQAVAANKAFFADNANRVLSRCSDEAWTLIRYESELTLLGEKGPKTTPQEVLDKQNTIDKCGDQTAEGYSDVWITIASMLKMQAEGGDLVNEIRHQLKYLETLRQVQTLAGRASNKIFRDHLYDAHDDFQERYNKLAARYNAVVDSLTAVPLPSNYQHPQRLHCETTSNHLGEWSTVTTDCQ